MAEIKKRRFAEMDETGKKIAAEVAILEKLLQPYEVFSDGQLSSYTLGFFKSKIKGKPLRAYFSRKLFEYLSYSKNSESEDFDDSAKEKEKELFFIKLPFVFEIVIVIQYLHNHILDDKYDVRKGQTEKINHNLVSSNILRELLFLYLHQEVKPLLKNENNIYDIHQMLSKLLLYVDLGQRIDKEYNTYIKWIRPSAFPDLISNRSLFTPFVKACIEPFMAEVKREVPYKNDFIETYFQRIYLTNVYFFECIVEIVMLAFDYKEREKDNLRKFSIQYGFMLQIINDYADYAYSSNEKERNLLKTASKKTTDFFADLFNFNVTLPLIYHLEEGSRRKIEAYLAGGRKQKRILNQYPSQIVNEIKESGAIRKCIDLSRQISNAARLCLDEQNPMTPYLHDMCEMAMDNKFYKIFV
ncbi:MAG: polyprenyl synthetase family protein [Saprospiraceae bacterium]